MRSSTDPADDTCEATFKVGDYEPVTMRMTNADYFRLAGILEWAWSEGVRDGECRVAVEVKLAIREYL